MALIKISKYDVQSMMAPIKDLTRSEKQAVSFVRADGPHQRPEALEKWAGGLWAAGALGILLLKYAIYGFYYNHFTLNIHHICIQIKC